MLERIDVGNLSVEESVFTPKKKQYAGLLLLLSTVKPTIMTVNGHCAYAVEYARLLDNVINPSKIERLLLIEAELEQVLARNMKDIWLLIRGEKPEVHEYLCVAEINRAVREYDLSRLDAFKSLLTSLSSSL
jgi:hypothetical protein